MLYKNRKLRHECKFLINSGTYEILKGRFKALMQPDVNSADGGYQVTSLYFDDLFFSAYHDKINGVDGRKKYRIRCYNMSQDIIRLECKHKDGEYVSKRNCLLNPNQYNAILNGTLENISADGSDPLLNEFVLSIRIKGNAPVCQTNYYREAFTHPDGNVRMTFDSRISTSVMHKDLFAADAIYTSVMDDIVFEMKYDDYIPHHIAMLLAGIELNKQPISKYALCFKKILEVRNYVR